MYNKTITNNEEENIEYDWGNGGGYSPLPCFVYLLVIMSWIFSRHTRSR